MEPHHSFNALDYTVIGILLLSGIMALMRGFVREVLSLGAWAASYFVAAKYYPLLEPTIHHYLKNQTAVTAIAATCVFFLTLIILTIISVSIASLIKGTALTSIDRSLGFLFGLLRGGLVVCLIYLAATSILWPNLDKPVAATTTEAQDKTKEQERSMAPDFLLDAKTRPALAYGAHFLKAFIPQSEIDKITKESLDQRAAAQRMIDQETLDALSVPKPASGKEDQPPTYDDKNRSGLDQLIDQKDKP